MKPYFHPMWRKSRAMFLRSRPFCVYCHDKGLRVRATVVDHIKPHDGDQKLFWDTRNWQPLCASCHSGRKKWLDKRHRVEDREMQQGWVTDSDGWLVRRKATG